MDRLWTYFEPDVISRQSVNTLVDELAKAITYEKSFARIGRSTTEIIHDILNLPSVTPQPKTGRWTADKKCSRCGCSSMLKLCIENYCANCGAKMVKSQAESEDK